MFVSNGAAGIFLVQATRDLDAPALTSAPR